MNIPADNFNLFSQIIFLLFQLNILKEIFVRINRIKDCRKVNYQANHKL